MIEAIKTGIIKLLFVFLAKITTKILPKKKLKPKATPIRPNVFALFSGLEISARIVVAVAAVPPLKPSISLAKNNKNNGIVAIEFDQLKRAKTFGLIGVAFGLSFFLGNIFVVIFAKNTNNNFIIPVLIASVIPIINFLLVFFYLPETMPNSESNKSKTILKNPLKELFKWILK